MPVECLVAMVFQVLLLPLAQPLPNSQAIQPEPRLFLLPPKHLAIAQSSGAFAPRVLTGSEQSRLALDAMPSWRWTQCPASAARGRFR